MLEKIAAVSKIPAAAIKNFDEEKANNYFNTFNDNSTGAFNNFKCTFNPIDKIIELYEALVKTEKDKVALLEKMLDKNR